MRSLFRFSFFLVFLSIGLSACVVLELRPTKRIEALGFEVANPDTALQLMYPFRCQLGDGDVLFSGYRLDSILAGSNDNLERVFKLTDHVHRRLDGKTTSKAIDLNAAEVLVWLDAGRTVSEMHYATLLTALIQASGLPARTVFLMTNDAPHVNAGAGHYITEVWLEERNQWMMADAQFNLVPMVGEYVLSAVDFQAAIINNRQYGFYNVSGKLSDADRVAYLKFIPHKLFYFAVAFDQRVAPDVPYTYGEYTHLILVPLEKEAPELFQRRRLLNTFYSTSSKSTFYQRP
jgi:hypothetical protein